MRGMLANLVNLQSWPSFQEKVGFAWGLASVVAFYETVVKSIAEEKGHDWGSYTGLLYRQKIGAEIE